MHPKNILLDFQMIFYHVCYALRSNYEIPLLTGLRARSWSRQRSLRWRSPGSQAAQGRNREGCVCPNETIIQGIFLIVHKCIFRICHIFVNIDLSMWSWEQILREKHSFDPFFVSWKSDQYWERYNEIENYILQLPKNTPLYIGIPTRTHLHRNWAVSSTFQQLSTMMVRAGGGFSELPRADESRASSANASASAAPLCCVVISAACRPAISAACRHAAIRAYKNISMDHMSMDPMIILQ